MFSKLKLLLNKLLGKFGYRLLKKKWGFHYAPNIYGKSWRKMFDMRAEPQFFNTAEEVIKSGKTCLYYDRLFYLFQAVREVAKNHGQSESVNILEIGVFRGGTSYFLAKLSQEFMPNKVNIFSVDTFEGHSEKDLPSGLEGKEHRPGLFNNVDFEGIKKWLSVFPFVEVIKGRIQDCAEIFSDKKFHLIHLDVDIYEPTLYSLSFFGDRMVSGGIIIVDDYGFLTCPGVKEAVDEDCLNRNVIKIFLESGQCLLFFK